MADRNVRNRKLISDDKKYVWHPFTQMADWQNDDPSRPLVINKGRGNYLYDVRGRKYLDGVSSLWVTLHGHNNSRLNNAVKKQLSKVAHSTFLGLTHEPAVKLAKELVKIAPEGLSRVFYSDSGATSVEIAIKMAYQYWKLKEKNSNRDTFLSLKNAYHGDTIGSVSVGGMDLFHKMFRPLLFKTIYAPSPYCYRCTYRHRCAGQCMDEFEKIVKKHSKRIAACIIEPMVQGAAGMITMPEGYMKKVSAVLKKHGILLICDEVATGFGRTGRMFACEHENIQPDFLCLAKGITGGYLPLAATLTKEKIYRAFLGRYEEFKTFFHGHTYTANPLGCAAALANLETFRRRAVISRIQPKIGYMRKQLSRLSKVPYIGDIRQCGMMTGMEIVKDKEKGIDFPVQNKTGQRICAQARKHGLIIRPLGNVIVLMPPLSITEHEIKKMIDTVGISVLKICEK
jgi:adenosylmethionine-8-amino-7-oxononanoate aminotransferase